MESEYLASTNLTFNCTEDYLGPQRDSLYVIAPITLVYVIILVTGIIGNISTCIVIHRNKTMHTATNYYLFSLAISDLLLLLTGLPQEVYLIWSRYPYIFGSTFCFLRGLFAEISTNATVLTITAFTIERYLAICHPFLTQTISKLSRVIKFILAIWILSITLAIPQALQFGILYGEGDCEICAFINPLFKYSFAISTFVFFVFPMTLIVVLYVLIGAKLRSSKVIKRKTSYVNVQQKPSRKVVKMLVAVVTAFFICWAPFHIQRLFTIYSSNSTLLNLRIYEIVTYISGILFYTSATINPILYNIMSIKFREAFKDTFRKCCCFPYMQPKESLSRWYYMLPYAKSFEFREPSFNNNSMATQQSSMDLNYGANLYSTSL